LIDLCSFWLLTTWHDKESIEEALWSFINCAEPDEAYSARCHDWIALSLGNDEWERRIRATVPAYPSAENLGSAV
jgi:hypothetical protein